MFEVDFYSTAAHGSDHGIREQNGHCWCGSEGFINGMVWSQIEN